jgi:alpha-1,2-mannosyltransferase
MLDRLRRRFGRMLTWRRARVYALVFVGVYVVAWLYVVVNGRPPLNSSGEPIGGDYIAFHTAGRMLLGGDGPRLYDRASVEAVQDATLGGLIPRFYDPFRNPPFFALVFAPLSQLDLLPSFAAWTALSVACLALSLWLLLDLVPELKPRWRGLAIVVFAFAPVYFGIIDGQNATLSLLLYVLIFRSMVRRDDSAAGIWAALGLFKPQLFVVFPIVFLARRRWRALAAYVLALTVLGLISFVLVGAEGLVGWVGILVDMESTNAARMAWRMHSLKAFFDLLVPGNLGLSMMLYTLSSVGLLIVLARAWVKSAADSAALWVLTVLVGVLVNPHIVDYDLTVLVLAGVLAAVYLPSLHGLIVLLYPMLVFRTQIPLMDGALQLSTIVLAGMAFAVWRGLRLNAPESPRQSCPALQPGAT